MQSNAPEKTSDELQYDADTFYREKRFREAAECILNALSLRDKDHYDLDCYLAYQLRISPESDYEEYSRPESRETIIKEIEEKLTRRRSRQSHLIISL